MWLTTRKFMLKTNSGTPNPIHLRKLANAIINLCRTAYYGTKKAQVLAGGAIPILVWLLNKPRLTRRLHLIIIRCLGELLYSSAELKFEVCQHHRDTFTSKSSMYQVPFKN